GDGGCRRPGDRQGARRWGGGGCRWKWNGGWIVVRLRLVGPAGGEQTRSQHHHDTTRKTPVDHGGTSVQTPTAPLGRGRVPSAGMTVPNPASAAPAPAPYVALREDPYKTHSLVVGYCGPNKRVLEIGCSTGYLSQALQRKGCRITGVEIDASAGAAAQRWCERVVIGDVESMDLAPLGAGYDVLLLADVLEHLRDPAAALR